MNKDLDERLIPNGQYRDALNIQISTSDESDVGSAQTLMGNTLRNVIENSGVYNIPTTSTCIGTIALPETDKIYYMVAASVRNDNGNPNDIQKDYILEYDTLKNTIKYVFVDIHNVKTSASIASNNTNNVRIPDLGSSTINKTGVRIGMKLIHASYGPDDNIKVTDIAYDTGNSRWKITLSKNVSVSSSDELTFIADRVLNYSKDVIITGINVLDDFLFWTDNITEPKKINIKRSIAGTGGTEYLIGGGVAGINNGTPTTDIFTGDTDNFHTRLVADRDNNDNFEVVTDRTGKKAVYVQEQNITVIKKSPTQALHLKMSDQKDPRVNSSGVTNPSAQAATIDFTGKAAGDDVSITFDGAVDFRVGDILLFTDDTSASISSFEEGKSKIRAVVTTSLVSDPDNLHATGFVVRILSISNNVEEASTPYFVRKTKADPLFENKFVRFSYRYKYQDGEYSTFAPFSELAFLPGNFDYEPRKGYNFGMSNRLRSLELCNYYSEELITNDVIGIDLLYKEDGKPTVYTVKSISQKDGHPIWPDTANNAYDRGKYVVTSDVIHAVLPSNQLLRPYDNVPRLAKAQEISANRLIYANYLQNYNADDPVLEISKHSQELDDIGEEFAAASVKSLRTYQVGVVFCDNYGRETPVLTSKNASVKFDKSCSTQRNRLFTRLKSDAPPWATHYSYYVKETSSEYYNMAMDRYYFANDGNIWLSFPSAERNKITEDDYLILKKAHRTNEPVYDKARYKVLAIENEAPDFIKTTRKLVGKCKHGSTQTISGGSGSGAGGNFGNGIGQGYPIPGESEVTIQRGAFIDSFGDQILTFTPDKLFLKVQAPTNSSEEYEVMKMSDDGTKITITLSTIFGEDMSFTDSDNTSAGTQPPNGLIITLLEHKIENRPEFDGRFFVKIYRDESLSKYVLSSDSDTEFYSIKDSWQLRYIHNNGYKGGPSFPITTSHRQRLKNESGNASAKNHPTELGHHTPTYQWGGTNSKRFGVTRSDVDSDPVHSLGNDAATYNNISPQAQEFWKGIKDLKSFFIDCCTAYQWTGHEDMIPGDRLNGNADNGFRGLLFKPDAENEWYNNNNNFTSAKKTTSNNQGGAISRGIWGTVINDPANPEDSQCFMDISWSGMENKPIWNPPYKHKLSEHNSGIRAEAWKFIERLCTPGTQFRFRNDPDGQVYTTFEYAYKDANGLTPGGHNEYRQAATIYTGLWGIRNYKDGRPNDNKKLYRDNCMRQRWTIGVKPAIGVLGSQYHPMLGTESHAAVQVRALRHDADSFDVIEIIEPANVNDFVDNFTDNPAVWEIEPRESVDLDIYYQASRKFPLLLTSETNEEYIPIGSTFTTRDSSNNLTTHTVFSWSDGQTITFTPALPANTTITDNQTITFITKNNDWIGSKIDGQVTSGSSLKLHGGPGSVSFEKLSRQYHMLDWSNCYSFGNGVESDRIRDAFNKPQIDTGVKASTVLAETVKEERRKHGLIFSGIYNSNVGVNNTNQFIAAEKITKDLNPVYGSIQKLFTRNTNLVTFCEDKVLKILTNKDALFNADGKANVTSNNMVLGQAVPYAGNYGISTNAESFAATPYEMYFADITRGQVLALSTEGVRSISDLGMKDYFTDLFKDYADIAIGSYDQKKKEYNITVGKRYSQIQLTPEFTTVSYSLKAKGWVSFRSYTPEQGISLNNEYYTFKGGQLYIHHDNEVRNNFYGTQYNSSVTVVFNDMPETVKSFGSLNYEGTQAQITQFTTSNATALNNTGGSSTVTFNDGEYYNLDAKPGWFVESIITNKQTGKAVEFKNKEGKYFSTICGDATTLSNLDEREFSVQGLGQASFSHSDPGGGSQPPKGQMTLTIADNVSTTYQGDDGTGGAWDTALQTNWVATQVQQTHTVTNTIPAQTVDLIISNIVGGSYSGFNLLAARFKIGGATNSSGNIWTGGNVDTNVTQVEFIDNGIAGDPANTVTARVSLSSFNAPTADLNIYVDIDDGTNPSTPAQRNLCVRVQHPFDSNQTVTYPVQSPYGATITRTEEQAGSSSLPTRQIYQSSTLLDGGWSTVVRVNFTAASGYYYEDANVPGGLSIGSSNISTPGFNYTSAYGTVIHNAGYTNGRLTSFSVDINYEPPPNPPLNPDPAHLCKLHHKFIVNSTLLAVPTIPANQVHSVNNPSTAPNISSTVPVTVNGTSGATYTVQVTQQLSPTSNSIVNENGYYNFTNNVFQTGSTNSGTQTIGTTGVNTHVVTLPRNTGGKKRFDIIIAAVGDTTLHAEVPNAHGEASIIQEGIGTLTIGGFTTNENNVTITGSTTTTMPTSNVKEPRTITTTGGTAGVTTTSILLDTPTTGIEPGMIISGTGVPTNTTVSVVNEDNVNITTNQNVTVTDGRTLIFSTNDGSVKTFEITVAPQGDNTLSITENGGRQPVASDFAVSNEVSTTSSGSHNSGVTTLNVSSTNGISSGMKFTFAGAERTVASVTSATALTFTPATSATVAAPVEIVFTKAQQGANVRVQSIEAFTDAGAVKVRGVIEVSSIPNDDEINIFLDNFISVN